jgi:hypothetical protein
MGTGANYGFTSAWNSLGGFSLNIGPGSCLGFALDTYKPLGKALKDVQKYAKDFGPAIQMLPAGAVQLEMSARTLGPWLVSKGADPVNTGMMAAAVGTGTATVGTMGASAMRVATNPAVLGTAADLSLLYATGNEAIAAYHGQCHP